MEEALGDGEWRRDVWMAEDEGMGYYWIRRGTGSCDLGTYYRRMEEKGMIVWMKRRDDLRGKYVHKK